MNIPTLRVATAPFNPWSVFGEGNDTSLRGVTIEIYNAMSVAKVFDYYISNSTVYGGSLEENNKWSGSMGLMLKNEADIGGPMFLSEQRSREVGFTVPLDFSKLAILSGLVQANKNPFLIFSIFPLRVWAVVLVSLLCAALTATMIYYALPPVSKKKSKKKFLETLFIYLWTFQISIIGKEFGKNSRWFLHHIWFSPSFRLLQGIWLLSTLVLSYTYQGVMVSTYAGDKLKPKYETLEDLLKDSKVHIGTFENSYPHLCLKKLQNTTFEPIYWRLMKNSIKVAPGYPYWLDPVGEGTTVLFLDNLYSQYVIGERYRMTGKCDIRVTIIEVCASFLSLGTRRGLPVNLLRSFDEGILRFNEGGLSRRQIAETLLFYELCTQQSASVTQPLDLVDLLGAFTILGIGLAVSSVCFLLESVKKLGTFA